MQDIFTKPALLVALCAAAYAAATLAMKASAASPNPALLVFIALCLGGAVLAEIHVLRQIDLGPAYIAILGAETLVVVAAAALIGEGLGPRDLAGAALVLGGIAMIGA